MSTSTSTTTTVSQQRELKYNLTWIEDTFTTQQTAETLLSPEREQGNLTSRDYELATRFLPGSHRYYPRGYGALATGLSLLYARSRRWSAPRLVFIGASAYTLGFAVGQAARLRLHLKFLSSLENFDGFSAALDSVNQKAGGIMPRGPTLVVSAPKGRNGGLGIRPDITGGDDIGGSSGWGDTDVETTKRDHTSSPPAVSSPGSPKSRWDDIRAANSQAATQSSWEAIRQKHGKDGIQGKGTTKATSEAPERLEDGDEERRLEQARFDALLEAERKIGHSHSKNNI